MTGGAAVPSGYAREVVNGAELVARVGLFPALREALREGSLHEYAAHHPDARTLVGRGLVFAVPLPDGETRAVIRRSRHGGLLAPVTGDWFVAPTRAPRELRTVLRLSAVGIPTPEVLAYATYPAGGLLRRADVATREVPGARDLDAALRDEADPAARGVLWERTAELLRRLTAVGARHPDLNLKNVLVAPDVNGAPDLWLLDVDRVWFDAAGSPGVTEANLRRLLRSARKRRRVAGTPIEDAELAALERALRAEAP